jgi:hypothetical protein
VKAEIVTAKFSRGRNRRRVGGASSVLKRKNGRACAHCGMVFVPFGPSYFYCSKTCAAEGLRKRYGF